MVDLSGPDRSNSRSVIAGSSRTHAVVEVTAGIRSREGSNMNIGLHGEVDISDSLEIEMARLSDCATIKEIVVKHGKRRHKA
jgi:hypothetical protein